MIQLDTIAGELAQCGGQSVLSDPKTVAAFALEGCEPRWVVSSESPEQVAAVVKLANRDKLAVLPRGGGTKSSMGGVPIANDIVLRTTAMNRVADYDGPNLTVSAEAGMTLGELRRTLADDGKLLPLDAPFDDATVGGVIATNQSGPRRLLYGSARDIVLGLRAVLPTGDLVHFGGKVMKNVAGYDMTRLLIGSWGTLGVLTEVTFRLLPLPEKQASLVAAFATLEQAAHAVRAVLASQFVPSALELANAAAWQQAAGSYQDTTGAAGFMIAIAFEGFHEAVERQVSELTALFGREGARDIATLRGDEESGLWERIRDFGRLAPGVGQAVHLKVSLPIARVEEAARFADKIAAENGLTCALLAHAGNGILYIHLAAPDESEEAFLVSILEIQRMAGDAGGSAVVESAPLAVKRRAPVWGEPRPEWALMRRLKNQFDPAGILNPGRFVGGM